MVRLLGIDVDGTLLDSRGRVTDENRAAVYSAVEAGVHVALVTGRSFPSVRPMVANLPRSLTLVVSNGAVERRMDGSTVRRRLLTRSVARRVLEATSEHRAATALIFDRDEQRQLFFESMDWTHPARQGYWFRNQRLIARSVPLEDALIEDPIQVMFNGAVADMRNLAERLGGDSRAFVVALTEYPDRDFSLLDVTSPQATKGQALRFVAEAIGIGPDEVMAVGDNLNDLDMLKFAGVPVVMGNAVPALMDHGWHVTGTHDESGLATALHAFVLGRS